MIAAPLTKKCENKYLTVLYKFSCWWNTLISAELSLHYRRKSSPRINFSMKFRIIKQLKNDHNSFLKIRFVNYTYLQRLCLCKVKLLKAAALCIGDFLYIEQIANASFEKFAELNLDSSGLLKEGSSLYFRKSLIQINYMINKLKEQCKHIFQNKLIFLFQHAYVSSCALKRMYLLTVSS